MKIKNSYILAALLLTYFLSSCKPSFQPNSPEEKYTNITLRQREFSTINIPVNIPLAELQRQINNQVKELIYEDNSFTDNNNDNIMVKVFKKDKITLTSRSGFFNISVPLRIWAKAGVKFDKFGLSLSEYKETEFELKVNFLSKIEVTPDWKVKTQTHGNGFDWITRPVLKIGIVQIPLTTFVEDIIEEQQGTIAKTIDAQISESIEIKSYVQQAWDMIQAPVNISEEYDTWLKITPSEIIMTPLMGDGKKVYASIGMKGYTETTTGKKPETEKSIPLPDLKVMNKIPDNFNIGLKGEISYEKASKLLGDQLINQTFSFKEGKYKISITSIDIYGSGERLIIKSGLKGSLNGLVYLSGIPFYDSLTQEVGIKNLDFDLDTKNKLIKTANWLAHGKFVSAMEKSFRFPIGDQLKIIKDNIDSTISNYQITEGINFKGNIEKIIPKQVYVTPSSITAVVIAQGKAYVDIEKW